MLVVSQRVDRPVVFTFDKIRFVKSTKLGISHQEHVPSAQLRLLRSYAFV